MFRARLSRGIGLAICILSVGVGASAEEGDEGVPSPRSPLNDALKSFRIECKDLRNRYVKKDEGGGVHIAAPGVHVDVTGSAAQHNLHVQAPFVNFNQTPPAANSPAGAAKQLQTGQTPGQYAVAKRAASSTLSGVNGCSPEKGKLAADKKMPALSNSSKPGAIARSVPPASAKHAVASVPAKKPQVSSPSLDAKPKLFASNTRAASKPIAKVSVLAAASSTAAKQRSRAVATSPAKGAAIVNSAVREMPPVVVSPAKPIASHSPVTILAPPVSAPSAVLAQRRYAPTPGASAEQRSDGLQPAASASTAASVSLASRPMPEPTAISPPTTTEYASGVPVRLLPAQLPPQPRMMPALADNSQYGSANPPNNGDVHVPFVDVTRANNGHKHVHVHLPFLHVDHDGDRGGVQVRAPLVNVNKTPGQPAMVRAPLTHVNANGTDGTSVRAPFTSVNKNPGQPAQIQAPFTNVHNNNSPGGVSVHAPLVKVEKAPGQPAAVQAPFTNVHNTKNPQPAARAPFTNANNSPKTP